MGVVPISVLMFFAGMGTVVFWLGRILGGAFPRKIPLDPVVDHAFAVPDFLLSILLFIGAYGLLTLNKLGFFVSLLAMGMWLFDALFVLGITRFEHIGFLGFSIFFAFFVIVYLWKNRDFFI